MKLTKQKETHRPKVSLCSQGRRDSSGGWEATGHAGVFKMENQQGPTVGHLRELCAVLSGSLDGRGFGKWIHAGVRLSTCCPPETVTTLPNVTPQNKTESLKVRKFFLNLKLK